MIRSITLRNFQVHESRTIGLDRVTCIIGPSDQGKTAILRALRWLCLNEPRGDAFISHGKEFARVKINLDSGDVITRQIGRKGNLYKVNGGEAYKAFGSSVPDEVAKLLDVDGNNFQGQLDPPFWLLSSPGEVSRSLNRIVDLERIDTVLSKCSGQIRSTKAAIGVCERRLEQAEADCERLAWVDAAYKEKQALIEREQDIARQRSELASARTLLSEARKVASMAQDAADAKLGALEVKAAFTRMQELADRIAEGRELIRQTREAQRACSEYSDEAARLRKDLERETGGACPACGRPSP
jgi:DNA repair protein SbcC/Rad50